MQVSPGKLGSNGERLPGRAVHLLRLLRGLTPAVIQDVAFSACGTLLTVSSARGTTHIYRLALLGESCLSCHVPFWLESVRCTCEVIVLQAKSSLGVWYTAGSVLKWRVQHCCLCLPRVRTACNPCCYA